MWWHVKKLYLLLFLFTSFLSSQLNACPCGCGSISMLSLYPSETWKVQASLTRDLYQGYTDQDGHKSLDLSPEVRDSLSIAVARRLAERLSLVLKVASQRNFHKDFGGHFGWEDPSLGLRFTVIQQNFIDVWMPQIDMTFLYKHPVGTSIDDSPDLSFHGIQIHGNGFKEYGPGVEITWNLLSSWSFGVGQSVIFKVPKNGVRGDEKVFKEPGLSYFSTVTSGYTFLGTGQLLGFWEYERRFANAEDSVRIPNSDSVRNGVGITGHLRVGTLNTISLTLRQAGDVFLNKNTPRDFSMTSSFTTAL